MRRLLASRRRSGAPARQAVDVNADGRPTRPDRLTLWPVDEASFGIDVLYLGPQGERRARVVVRQLEEAEMAVALRREGESGWLVRLGPVDREGMLAVLNGYVW